jgi:hypothetical protein
VPDKRPDCDLILIGVDTLPHAETAGTACLASPFDRHEVQSRPCKSVLRRPIDRACSLLVPRKSSVLSVSIPQTDRTFVLLIMDKKYGAGNYDVGAGSEYSKAKKWGRAR